MNRVVDRASLSAWVLGFALLLVQLVPLSAQAVELPDFTELAARNGKVVVNISTTAKHGARERGMDMPRLPDGHPLNDWFKRFFDGPHGAPRGSVPPGDEGEEGRSEPESLGSGFVISADGYILTNNHVVEDADEIFVSFNDRRQLKAELVGTDPQSDVAVLKVDAHDLPVAKIGHSEDLKVGEWVLAIGSPFGFDYSVTAGIVSAVGRNLPSENYVPFIQTDVAINPGNSGGPLFNLDGEVVGINSQIFSRSGGFMGLSFAIPIDIAMDVAQQLKDKGKVSRGWLGVLIQDVSPELAESFDLDRPQGALVSKVLDDSPAQQAGIKVGDVILSFDGHLVPTSSSLPPMVGRTRVGRTVDVVVLRDGERVTLPFAVGELPEQDEVVARVQSPQLSQSNRLGMSVEDLDDATREAMGLSGDDGVRVRQVTPGPAWDAGIRAGDVILMLDNEPVSDADRFVEIVKDLPEGKRSVAVLVHRESGPTFLALRLR